MAGGLWNPRISRIVSRRCVWLPGDCCGVCVSLDPTSRICWVFRGYPRRTYPRLDGNAGAGHQEDALREHLMLTRESATAVLAC